MEGNYVTNFYDDTLAPSLVSLSKRTSSNGLCCVRSVSTTVTGSACGISLHKGMKSGLYKRTAVTVENQHIVVCQLFKGLYMY
jgi:hypothetical protein